MLTSSYVKKYKERNKQVLFLWQEYTNKAPFYPTSCSPDFPTSGAQTDLMPATIMGYKQHTVIAIFSFVHQN